MLQRSIFSLGPEGRAHTHTYVYTMYMHVHVVTTDGSFNLLHAEIYRLVALSTCGNYAQPI